MDRFGLWGSGRLAVCLSCAGAETWVNTVISRVSPWTAQEAGEPLPSEAVHVLKGHDGPVLAVRFNRAGTYCLSAGRVGCNPRLQNHFQKLV